MIPQHQISTVDRSAGGFQVDRHAWYGRDCTFRGGVALGDGSQGIDYQTWLAQISGRDSVIVAPLAAGASTTLTIVKVQAASVAFDRSMNLAVGFVQDGKCFLYWFDTIANKYALTEMVGARNILVVHDDVRDSSSQTSDVICTYQRGKAVYWREQRDRYAVEYTANANAKGELFGFGMGNLWSALWYTAPIQ